MKHPLMQILIPIRRLAQNTHRRFSNLTFGALLILLPISASAATLPDYYPEDFQMSGVIDQIDIKRGVIVVNDLPWSLSMNARVQTMNSEFSRLLSLRTGMIIGFKMNSINGKMLIAEIWVLPDNYLRHNSKDENAE